MRISFIVSTRNRATSLPRCLAGISVAAEQASHIPVELVLVDNGSTDGTTEVFEAWIRNAPLEGRLVRERKPGLARARNAGVVAATGAILAFTDDDCEIAPNYIIDLDKHFSHDAGPVLRGGRVELGDATDLPFTIKMDSVPCVLRDDLHPGNIILGCNMAMSREVLEIVGPFDERFGAGAPFKAAEETDLVYRAHRAGIRIEYVPDMLVRHFHGRKHRDEIKSLSSGYFIGNGALYAKHLFGGGQLYRHLYWDFRKAMRELIGGKQLDPSLGLTYRNMIYGNLRGMMQYWLYPPLSKF